MWDMHWIISSGMFGIAGAVVILVLMRFFPPHPCSEWNRRCDLLLVVACVSVAVGSRGLYETEGLSLPRRAEDVVEIVLFSASYLASLALYSRLWPKPQENEPFWPRLLRELTPVLVALALSRATRLML